MSRRGGAPTKASEATSRMAARTKEIELATRRNYRKFSAQQKLEIVLAGLRGDRSVKGVCRDHEIAETLYYNWRDKLLEGGREQLAGKEEHQGEKELRKRVRELERALGRKTYELEVAGKHCGAGSERARRPVPHPGRTWPQGRGRGARDAGFSPGDLSDAETAHRSGAAAGVGGGRRGDRRGRARQSDRRHPDGRRPRQPRTGPAGEQKASAAGDAPDKGCCSTTGRCIAADGRGSFGSSVPISSGTWT